MSDGQFTKLFRYMESFRKDVNARFEANDREHAELKGIIAELAVGLKELRDEVLVISAKIT